MRPNKQFMLVRIDKQQQAVLREKTKGGIFIPEKYLYMKYNLQYGEIISIGEKVHRIFPEAQPGDMAIFHHFVESQPHLMVSRENNGDELRLVRVDPDVITFQLFGIITKAGELIPFQDYIFLDPEVKTIKKKGLTLDSSGLIVGESMWDDDDFLLREIARLNTEIKWIAETFDGLDSVLDWKKVDEIEKDIKGKKEQIQQMTAYMNRFVLGKATVLHVHPKTEKENRIKPGFKHVVAKKELYPIYFAGNEFKIANKNMILGIYR